MYRSIDVWKRIDERRVVRYRCFQNIASGKYCVQSADYIDLPFDEEQDKHHKLNFIELLCEAAPDQRAGSFDDLSDAISRHELDFGENLRKDSRLR